MESVHIQQIVSDDRQVTSEGKQTARHSRPRNRIGYNTESDNHDSDKDHEEGSDKEGSEPDERSSYIRGSEQRPSKRRRTDIAPHEDERSVLTLRSHFLASSVEERLEFLSWLFESTLPRCISESPSAVDVSSTTGKVGRAEAQLARRQARPHKTSRNLNAKKLPQVNSRKGKPWSPEEVSLLVRLRKDQNLPWSEVTKQFTDRFPGRTQGSIQVYWSTKLKSNHEESSPR